MRFSAAHSSAAGAAGDPNLAGFSPVGFFSPANALAPDAGAEPLDAWLSGGDNGWNAVGTVGQYYQDDKQTLEKWE